MAITKTGLSLSSLKGVGKMFGGWGNAIAVVPDILGIMHGTQSIGGFAGGQAGGAAGDAVGESIKGSITATTPGWKGKTLGWGAKILGNMLGYGVGGALGNKFAPIYKRKLPPAPEEVLRQYAINNGIHPDTFLKPNLVPQVSNGNY